MNFAFSTSTSLTVPLIAMGLTSYIAYEPADDSRYIEDSSTEGSPYKIFLQPSEYVCIDGEYIKINGNRRADEATTSGYVRVNGEFYKIDSYDVTRYGKVAYMQTGNERRAVLSDVRVKVDGYYQKVDGEYVKIEGYYSGCYVKINETYVRVSYDDDREAAVISDSDSEYVSLREYSVNVDGVYILKNDEYVFADGAYAGVDKLRVWLIVLIVLILFAPTLIVLIIRLSRMSSSVSVTGGLSESDFDRRVHEKVNSVSERCYEFLGVDKSQTEIIKPVRFYGVDTDSKLLRYDRRRNKCRASGYCSTEFLFSDERLYYYRYKFSMISPDYSEESGEILYKDISNIDTKREFCTAAAVKKKSDSKMGKTERILGGLAPAIIIGLVVGTPFYALTRVVGMRGPLGALGALAGVVAGVVAGGLVLLTRSLISGRKKRKAKKCLVEINNVALYTATNKSHPVVRARFSDMPEAFAAIHGIKQLIREKHAD
ncbi:MAG: hypothetical protein LBP26_00020 [Clostridiales bacterium]|nr:hypothetical protein [Clostridiales bacterium]